MRTFAGPCRNTCIVDKRLAFGRLFRSATPWQFGLFDRGLQDYLIKGKYAARIILDEKCSEEPTVSPERSKLPLLQLNTIELLRDTIKIGEMAQGDVERLWGENATLFWHGGSRDWLLVQIALGPFGQQQFVLRKKLEN